MMLNDRSNMNGRVATAVRAGPGKGRPARRPVSHPETGMTNRPATVTHLRARP